MFKTKAFCEDISGNSRFVIFKNLCSVNWQSIHCMTWWLIYWKKYLYLVRAHEASFQTTACNIQRAPKTNIECHCL